MKREIICAHPPAKLTIETSAACNLRCVMCWNRMDPPARPPFLFPDAAKKIEPFYAKAHTIELHGNGEPLISPAFWEFVKKTKAGEQNVTVNTNFNLQNPALARELALSNLSMVNVSLDAATSSTYAKIRGASFAQVLRNIKTFLAHRAAAGKSFPRIMINMTLMRENIGELPRFIRLAKTLGVNAVFFGHLNRWSDDAINGFVVERGAFTFRYAEQGLWNCPELSDAKVAEAFELARRLGVEVPYENNKNLYFAERNRT